MPTDIVMPQMGESIFEGTITKWGMTISVGIIPFYALRSGRAQTFIIYSSPSLPVSTGL